MGTIENLTAELQGQLCAALQLCAVRLQSEIFPEAPALMKCFNQVLQMSSGGNTIHEEALSAIGALAQAIGQNFTPFMVDFAPFVLCGLTNYQEVQACEAAVSVVGDVARAMGHDILPYCDGICMTLYQNLQNPKVDRKIKPIIMTCFGDIALAIGKDFERWMPPVVLILQEAALPQLHHGPQDNEEWKEYLHSLREGVLRAYTGILSALRDSDKAHLFKDQVNGVLELVASIVEGPHHVDTLKAAFGVLIDLVLAYEVELTKFIVNTAWLKKALKIAEESRDQELKHYGQNLKMKLQQYPAA
eukprot:Platyproteum_vivax@DN5907_c0_g1_i5.p1